MPKPLDNDFKPFFCLFLCYFPSKSIYPFYDPWFPRLIWPPLRYFVASKAKLLSDLNTFCFQTLFLYFGQCLPFCQILRANTYILKIVRNLEFQTMFSRRKNSKVIRKIIFSSHKNVALFAKNNFDGVGGAYARGVCSWGYGIWSWIKLQKLNSMYLLVWYVGIGWLKR